MCLIPVIWSTQLSGVGIDVEEFAHVMAVADLHLPDEVVGSGSSGHKALAEDGELLGGGRQFPRVLLLCDDRQRGLFGGAGVHRRIDRANLNVGHQSAVGGHQLPRRIEVQAKFAAEDRNAPKLLVKREVVAAEAVADAAGLNQIPGRVADPKRRAVTSQESRLRSSAVEPASSMDPGATRSNRAAVGRPVELHGGRWTGIGPERWTDSAKLAAGERSSAQRVVHTERAISVKAIICLIYILLSGKAQPFSRAIPGWPYRRKLYHGRSYS